MGPKLEEWNLQVQLVLCLLILFWFLLIGTSNSVLINGSTRGRCCHFIWIILVHNVSVIFLFNYNVCELGVHKLWTAFFTGSSLIKDSCAAVQTLLHSVYTKPFFFTMLVINSFKCKWLMEVLCASLKLDNYNSVQRNERNVRFLWL